MADKISKKSVDFSNVKEGSGFRKTRVPQGDYKAKITAVADAPSKKDGVFQWCFTIDLPEGGVYPYYCKLQENQLWKLRNLLVAAGKNVPKKKVSVDPSVVVGKWIGVTMEDDEYDDKAQSNVAAVFPASDLTQTEGPGDEEDEDEEEDEDTEEEEDDEEDEEEEPTPPPARKKKRKPAPEPEPEEEDEEEEEDEDEEDEEDEEEEPPPPPKKKKAKKPEPKKKKKTTVTDDELEELDIDGL